MKGTRIFQLLLPFYQRLCVHRKTTAQTHTERSRMAMAMEPVLAHAKLDNQFELEVDASGYTVGAVLLQQKEDGKKHPIGYYSATINEVQWNYNIYNLELLAIVMALKNWRPLLAGSPHKIIIYSNHLNLQYRRLPQRIS